MKIGIACDSFKGSLSSNEANKAIAEGCYRFSPDLDIHSIPIADGGEGSLDCFLSINNQAVEQKITVRGALGESREIRFGWDADEKTAFIEIAEIVGLPHIPLSQRNPLDASTYGVGEAILHAVHMGAEEIILGLGGSSTIDGGIGILMALGFTCLDNQGNHVPLGGRSLGQIDHILQDRVNPLLYKVNFTILCDVSNPLYGEQGAVLVFGPQKGATPEQLLELEAGMIHYSHVLRSCNPRFDWSLAGMGAAGGILAAIATFFHYEIHSGIEYFLKSSEFDKIVSRLDLMITGEGRLDSQTLSGKVPLGIAHFAHQYKVPVVALVGSYTGDLNPLFQNGLTAVFSILPGPELLDTAIEHTYEHLVSTSENVIRLFCSKNITKYSY